VEDLIGPIAFLVAVAGLIGAAVIGARRFAEQRKREGLWDDKGPIDPSLPPPEFLRVHPQPWGIARPTIESEDEDEDEDEAPPSGHHHHRR
jgi:hypothetical protein